MESGTVVIVEHMRHAFGSYREVAEYIDKAFYDYNNVRLHSALWYMTPNEFYRNWLREHGNEVESVIPFQQR